MAVSIAIVRVYAYSGTGMKEAGKKKKASLGCVTQAMVGATKQPLKLPRAGLHSTQYMVRLPFVHPPLSRPACFVGLCEWARVICLPYIAGAAAASRRARRKGDWRFDRRRQGVLSILDLVLPFVGSPC